VKTIEPQRRRERKEGKEKKHECFFSFLCVYLRPLRLRFNCFRPKEETVRVYQESESAWRCGHWNGSPIEIAMTTSVMTRIPAGEVTCPHELYQS